MLRVCCEFFKTQSRPEDSDERFTSDTQSVVYRRKEIIQIIVHTYVELTQVLRSSHVTRIVQWIPHTTQSVTNHTPKLPA